MRIFLYIYITDQLSKAAFIYCLFETTLVAINCILTSEIPEIGVQEPSFLLDRI